MWICPFYSWGWSSSSFHPHTHTPVSERDLVDVRLDRSFSHYDSFCSRLWGRDCSFVSAGSFLGWGFIFCWHHCLPFGLWGPHTKTHTTMHPSPLHYGNSRQMWLKAGRKARSPSPSTRHPLIHMHFSGGQGRQGEEEGKEEEKRRRARLIHQ